MKDKTIKKNLVNILKEGKNPSDIVLAIDGAIDGLTRIKTKGNGRITFYNHTDGYSLELDDKTIKELTLAAYAQGYTVEAHLAHNFSTKHHCKAFREAARAYAQT